MTDPPEVSCFKADQVLNVCRQRVAGKRGQHLVQAVICVFSHDIPSRSKAIALITLSTTHHVVATAPVEQVVAEITLERVTDRSTDQGVNALTIRARAPAWTFQHHQDHAIRSAAVQHIVTVSSE